MPRSKLKVPKKSGKKVEKAIEVESHPATLEGILQLLDETELDDKKKWYIQRLAEVYDSPKASPKTKLDILKELRETIMSDSSAGSTPDWMFDPALEVKVVN